MSHGSIHNERKSTSNAIVVTRKGDSLDFVFDLDGDSIAGWVCTITVKKLPADTTALTRIIEPDTRLNQWSGFLTGAETLALATNGLYRLIGSLVNATTSEKVTDLRRFSITTAW